jgi:hypothetical protein
LVTRVDFNQYYSHSAFPGIGAMQNLAIFGAGAMKSGGGGGGGVGGKSGGGVRIGVGVGPSSGGNVDFESSLEEVARGIRSMVRGN